MGIERALLLSGAGTDEAEALNAAGSAPIRQNQLQAQGKVVLSPDGKFKPSFDQAQHYIG
jgi:hypothetical protein